MTKFWIGVVGQGHAQTGMERGICAFSHGKKSAVARLSLGDHFAFYAPREGYKEGAVIQAFVALGEVVDEAPFLGEIVGFEAWLRKADYRPPCHVPVKPLLHEFSFVKNPQNWGMAFRRSLFEISKTDFALIEQAANG